jgi:hypothetical protein
VQYLEDTWRLIGFSIFDELLVKELERRPLQHDGTCIEWPLSLVKVMELLREEGK